MTEAVARSSQDERSIGKKEVNGKLYQLFVNSSGMRSVMVEIEPGKDLEGRKEHSGEEFKYVFEGSVEFTVGEEKYLLGPGDWLWHDSQVPHGAKNIGPQTCRYLTVVSLS